MYLSVFIAGLAAASVVSASSFYPRDGPDGPDGPGGLLPKNGTVLCDKDQCLRLQLLERFVKLASNVTNLEEITNNNATEIAAIQAKAAVAQASINTLTSNATLVTVCNVIFAYQASVDQCRDMQFLEQLEHRAANLTLLQKEFHGNQTLVDEFLAKAAAEVPALNALQSNTTLTQFCSVEDTKAQCHVIKVLQREISLAANLTAHPNATDAHPGHDNMIKQVQDRASKAAAELQLLLSNSTLVAACAQFHPDDTTGQQSLGQDPTSASQEAAGTSAGTMSVPRPAGLSGIIFAGLIAVGVALLAV